MVQIARNRTRSADRRRQILGAASTVFRRKGLHSTGMRDIAAELDMAVGSLYYYFDDKQELLAFCQRDALDGLLRLVRHVTRLALRPDEKLYLVAVGHLVRLHEGTPGSVAHLEVEGLDGARRVDLVERRDEYEHALRALVAEGVAQELFRPVDVTIAGHALLGALNWTVKWLDPEGTRTPREVGERFAEILVRGLLAPGRELRRPPEEMLAIVEGWAIHDEPHEQPREEAFDGG